MQHALRQAGEAGLGEPGSRSAPAQVTRGPVGAPCLRLTTSEARHTLTGLCRHAAWWTWLTLRLPLLGSPQLLQRIALTTLFLALARLGMFIPLPGVGFYDVEGGCHTKTSPLHSYSI